MAAEGEKRTCPNCGNFWVKGESLFPSKRQPIFLAKVQRLDADTTRKTYACDACHRYYTVTDNPSWEHAEHEVQGYTVLNLP